MEKGAWMREGLAEKVGRKGWQRVGEGLAQGWNRLAQGWRRVPCTLQLCNSRNAHLEERVCGFMKHYDYLHDFGVG